MGFTSSQLATASLMGSIGGAASSAIGSYYSAATNKINLQGAASIAESNARMAEMSAQSALNRGQKQVGNLTLKAGHLKSSQRAAMAANGIDLGEGNAAEVQASTDILKEIDKNTIETNATYDAWGYRLQGTNYQNDAILKRAGADTISPFSAAATSLLGSAGSVGSNWYFMNKSGALKGTMFELKD